MTSSDGSVSSPRKEKDKSSKRKSNLNRSLNSEEVLTVDPSGEFKFPFLLSLFFFLFSFFSSLFSLLFSSLLFYYFMFQLDSGIFFPDIIALVTLLSCNMEIIR